MTIEEARKILGEVAKDMSDTEIEKVVDNLDNLAGAFIQSYMRGEIKHATNQQTPANKTKIK